MNKKLRFVASATLAFSASMQMAYSAPVEFDTEDAHVIVIRPVDLWSPSERGTEYVLDRYKLKQVRYRLSDETGKMVTSSDDDPLSKEVSQVSQAFGFEMGGGRSMILAVEKPASLDSKEMPSFLNAQNAIFKESVFKSGNPSELIAKNKSQQWLATTLGLLTAAVGINKLGSIGAQVMQGPMQDVYALTMQARQSIVPQPAVPFEYSSYKSVDVRRVTISQAKDHIGQIIIAYRNDKTLDAEQRALAKAIVAAAGADTTLDAVVASQANDLAMRQSIWDACVAAKECQPN